jgi:hypothetical protein
VRLHGASLQHTVNSHQVHHLVKCTLQLAYMHAEAVQADQLPNHHHLIIIIVLPAEANAPTPSAAQPCV